MVRRKSKKRKCDPLKLSVAWAVSMRVMTRLKLVKTCGPEGTVPVCVGEKGEVVTVAGAASDFDVAEGSCFFPEPDSAATAFDHEQSPVRYCCGETRNRVLTISSGGLDGPRTVVLAFPCLDMPGAIFQDGDEHLPFLVPEASVAGRSVGEPLFEEQENLRIDLLRFPLERIEKILVQYDHAQIEQRGEVLA
jgi:hypothetical protein